MKVIVTFSGGKDSLAALLWRGEHITRTSRLYSAMRAGNCLQKLCLLIMTRIMKTILSVISVMMQSKNCLP